MHRGGAPAFLVALLAASRAFAQAAPQPTALGDVNFKWNAPAECPTSEAVLAQIERNIGAAKFGHADVEADVTTLGPQRWSVLLVTNVDDARGERSLEANSCAALADATALIVALTINPMRDDAPATPVTPSKPANEPLITKHDDEEESPPAKSTLGGFVALTMLGDLGTLPRVAAAPGLTVGLTYEHFRGEVSGNLWFAQDATTPNGSSEGSQLQLLDLATRGCWREVVASIEIAPCLGAGVVHLSSNGFGETFPQEGDEWWVTARADLIATWTIAEPLAIRVLAGAVLPFARNAIDLVNSTGDTVQLHRPALISGQIAIGVEAHFP